MKTIVLGLGLALLLGLAACGGGGDNDNLNADGEPPGGDGIGVIVDHADDVTASPAAPEASDDTMGQDTASGGDLFGSRGEGSLNGTLTLEDGELFAPESGQGVDGG